MRYLQLNIYPQYYDYEAYEAMIDEFMDISSIKNFKENSEFAGNIESMVNPWMENLNNK